MYLSVRFNTFKSIILLSSQLTIIVIYQLQVARAEAAEYHTINSHWLELQGKSRTGMRFVVEIRRNFRSMVWNLIFEDVFPKTGYKSQSAYITSTYRHFLHDLIRLVSIYYDWSSLIPQRRRGDSRDFIVFSW